MPENKQVEPHVPHVLRKSGGDPELLLIVVLVSGVVDVVRRRTISIVHQRTCLIVKAGKGQRKQRKSVSTEASTSARLRIQRPRLRLYGGV